MNVRPYRGIHPKLGPGAWVDPAATVVGDVELGADVSIWPKAVVRGDVNFIRTGARSNVQDGSVLHVTRPYPGSEAGRPRLVGEDVVIAHNVTVHGCTIGNRVLVGIGSVVLDGVVVQEQEIRRKQKELEANVQKPADAERYKVETLANARKFQLETEAAGTASAAKATGFANADVAKATGIAEAEASKAKGLAEAAIIEAQGKATAEAMRMKAASFKEYNEAAVIEMIVRILPDVAGKISEPLSKTEKMIIINSGNGVGGGASKLTGDVSQIAAQLPPVIESLTGVKRETLLEKVPGLKKSPVLPAGEERK